MIENCSLKKCISKLIFQKTSQYCSLKKYISKTHTKLLSQKCISKLLSQRYIFISASINAVNNKADVNKSTIIHD